MGRRNLGSSVPESQHATEHTRNGRPGGTWWDSTVRDVLSHARISTSQPLPPCPSRVRREEYPPWPGCPHGTRIRKSYSSDLWSTAWLLSRAPYKSPDH